MHQHQTTGAICDRRGAPRRPFPRRYTSAHVGLLAEVDALHGTLSGPATHKLCARAFHLFGDRRFERLAAISNGHLYNLRHTTRRYGMTGSLSYGRRARARDKVAETAYDARVDTERGVRAADERSRS